MTNQREHALIASESAEQEDRRSSPRACPAASTLLWISVDKRIRAKLVDECEQGIGLVVPIALEVGFRVRVEHSGGRRTAKVIHVSETENGCYRLGLSWID